ncbi:hypothetical protein [Prauserella alba]|uniref:Cell division protein FtsK n=1 Tax=Prauserella alba TaxID=176898 RepID=A0ABP4G3H4_9PSEU|nr:hypothetical protein [Prauserella alba]MCP2180030.1 DNA segregation ATPase FtsK/SpoIIIE, S-DNA-T family [Prauserella alba]
MSPRDEHTPHGHDEQANVVYLPTDRDDAPTVVDAEVIDGDDERAPARTDQARQAYNTRLIPTAARERMATGAVVAVRRTAPVAAAGTRAAVRHALYPVYGTRAVVRRFRDSHGSARFERQMRTAEAAGDQESLRYWHEAKSAENQRKHERKMDWTDSPVKLLKALGAGLAGLGVLLLLAGTALAIGGQDLALFIAPITGMLDAIRWAWWFGTAYGALLVLAATAGGALYLWNEGRKQDDAVPAWAQSQAQHAETAETYAVINEDMLTKALSHCKVSGLDKALKAGEPVLYDVVPRQQGGGTYVQIRLPFGVVAADFLHPDKVERLAGNLGRHKHEVYPQRQPEADARVLDLWIADQGTMDRPAPTWPLLAEGEFDVFRDGIPWGVTMRGEPVEQGALARHGLVGAVSKQGKTAMLRIHALSVALDPTVELRIADLKGDGDWSMFAPRAATLIEGSADEQAEATCAMLEDLVAEMMRRYDRKRALGVKGAIPRKLSRQPGSDFHPIFAYIDECQVLYQSPHPIGTTKADARAWRAAKRLHDQARAVNIQLWQATQRPDPTAIPAPVREGAHVRLGLYVPNAEAAKMVLADAADMGARPQDLRPGKDRGTFVATGEFDAIGEGMAFLITKSYFVDTKDAYPVIDRAMRILDNHGRTVTPAADDTDQGEDVDPLLDIAEALGHEPRLGTQQVLQRLTEHNHTHYESWTFADLTSYLRQFDAEPRKYQGYMVVRSDLVHEAITNRDETASTQRAAGDVDPGEAPGDEGSSPHTPP